MRERDFTVVPRRLLWLALAWQTGKTSACPMEMDGSCCWSLCSHRGYGQCGLQVHWCGSKLGVVVCGLGDDSCGLGDEAGGLGGVACGLSGVACGLSRVACGLGGVACRLSGVACGLGGEAWGLQRPFFTSYRRFSPLGLNRLNH